MVLVPATGVLAHQDVVELRIRAQQFAALNRRARRALAAGQRDTVDDDVRQAEEGIRHLIEQR